MAVNERRELKPHVRAGHPDDLLSSREVAQWLRCSVIHLQWLRHERKGPRYLKLGPRMLRYKRADVETWLAKHGKAA